MAYRCPSRGEAIGELRVHLDEGSMDRFAFRQPVAVVQEFEGCDVVGQSGGCEQSLTERARIGEVVDPVGDAMSKDRRCR